MPELSDRLELAESVELTAVGIVDHVTGVTYPANSSALALLTHDGSLGDISKALARRWAVDEATVGDDVLRFAWSLNQEALANVLPASPPWTRCLRAMRTAMRLLPVGRLPAANVRRRRVETGSFGAAVATAVHALYGRALTYVLGVTCAFGLPVALLSVGPSPALAPSEIAAPVAGVAIATALAFLVHEIGHLLGLRGVPAAIVLRRGRTSVIHQPLTGRRDALVALAGPATAALVGVGVAMLAYIGSDTVFALAACPFCGHTVSATIAARDGRTAIGLNRVPVGGTRPS